MQHFDYIVIGSGFSAFPAVQRLINKKKKFAVIDIGQKINKKLSNFYEKRSWKYIEKNKKELTQKLDELQSNSSVKLSYGSNHSYYFSKKFNNELGSKFDQYYSKSLGGFSNNWGGVLYLYNSKELKNWPISKKNLYKDINEICKMFQLDKKSISELISFEKEILKKDQFYKDAVLALKNCKSRGMCMYGCPENNILNIKDLFKKLINKKKINYFPNLKLEKISQKKGIELECTNINNMKSNTFSAKKVFLAAGPVSTSDIIIKSFDEIEELRIKDSTMFAFPIINLNKEKRKIGKQMCSKIFKYHKHNDNFLIQIYNDIDFFLHKLPKFLRVFFNDFLKLSIGIGYLSSKDSPELVMKKESNKDVNYSSNKKSNLLKRVYFLSLFCIKNLSKGMITLPFFQFKFKDFSSYHLGSSLPMTKKSTKTNKAFTDNLGRLNNNKNIIILDSSNFSDIQPGSISLMSAINSLRITKANIK